MAHSSANKGTFGAVFSRLFQRGDPSFTYAYANKGWALNELKRFKKALAACNEAIRLNRSNTYAYSNKSWALNGRRKHRQALAASDKAIQQDDTNVFAYDQKNWALDVLGRHNETFAVLLKALAACEREIRKDPPNDELAVLYYRKGWALSKLQRPKEAEEAFDTARELGCSC
jgi:tetratricopeptide (TPR) repeat protein